MSQNTFAYLWFDSLKIDGHFDNYAENSEFKASEIGRASCRERVFVDV